jgi:ubiquinone/menaquinone biosynthesis C-methylase UbiE
MSIELKRSQLAKDYSSVTESPNSRATYEQLARLYQRYHFAARYVRGRRVLEVACGSGQGLGYIARSAQQIVGGDYTENLLNLAHAHYGRTIPLVRLDAHFLPFHRESFEVVLLLEAIYYLAQAEEFVAECRRILTKEGILVICTVNHDWSEFARSPFSTRYFSVPELKNLLVRQGFTHTEFFGAFPTTIHTLKHRLVSLLRRLVVVLNLVPRTLEGREIFKRIFYGKLVTLKPEVEDGMVELYPVVPIPSDTINVDHKIVYVVASTSAKHSI